MFTADNLRYFLEVARSGRLSDAARKLAVDQTTVGRRITALERAVGQRLFDRRSAGWRLTEAGNRLVRHAETVESALAAAFEEQTSAPGALSGTVRIVAPDGFGAFVLTPELGRIRRQHPALAIELVTATDHGTVAAREFDVAVTLEPPSPRAVTARLLATYSLRLYASPAYLESTAAQGISSVDDLRRHTLIWYVDSLLDIAPLRILDAVVPGADAMVQTNNITGHWLAARAGLGIAPLPSYLGEPDDQLVPVLADEVCVDRKYWVVTPRELATLARVQLVESILHEIVRDNPYFAT